MRPSRPIREARELMESLLTPDQMDRFLNHVLSLMKIGWTNDKIAQWAATGEAFGHQLTYDEARKIVTVLILRHNRLQSELGQRKWARIMDEPAFHKAIALMLKY